MKQVRIIQSEWGGLVSEVWGALELYGFRAEVIEPKTRDELKRVCDEAVRGETVTVLLMGEGFLNQFGKDLPSMLPEDAGNLRVVWRSVEPAAHLTPQFKAADSKEMETAILEAVGESPERLKEIFSSINKVFQPRFDEAVLSYGEFFSYDSEIDLELHLPVSEVKAHFENGDLQEWLNNVVREADERCQ